MSAGPLSLSCAERHIARVSTEPSFSLSCSAQLSRQVVRLSPVPGTSAPQARALRVSRRMRKAPVCESGNGAAFVPKKPTLVDIPVSYNGAKCRYIIYSAGLEDKIDTISPADLGGLKSPEYLALNPQGKMPALILPAQSGGKPQCIAESEVVLQYLIEKFCPEHGMGKLSSEQRAIVRQAARVIDVYTTPIQAASYRQMDPEVRATNIKELARQLDILETYVEGPFVLGNDISCADIAILPTLIWMNFIMPRFFGWKSIFSGRPKLQSLFEAMQKEPAGAKINGELEAALSGWEEKGRWKDVGITDQVANTSFEWACS
ncbi:hypothetical protein WJX73_004301 [Symbiochloris irregularis]|uniref:Glutathione S-transferase n=1 Tax=Symbiochloris irregularis TaxID=706552 RepID=A0AAW1P837_9CHLO